MSDRPSTHAASRSGCRPRPAAFTAHPAPALVVTSADLLLAGSHGLDLPPARLEELRHQSRCTLAAAERARAPISCLGPGFVPDRPRLYPAAASDWVLTPLEDDPLHRNGRFPIPAKARRHLGRLHRARISFDDVLVAHEIPKDLAPSVLPVPAVGGAIELDPADLADLIVHPGPAPSTRRFAATAGNIAGAIGRLAGTAGKVVATAAVAPILTVGCLDPVIFGIQRIPGEPHAGVIYELVRWEW